MSLHFCVWSAPIPVNLKQKLINIETKPTKKKTLIGKNSSDKQLLHFWPQLDAKVTKIDHV